MCVAHCFVRSRPFSARRVTRFDEGARLCLKRTTDDLWKLIESTRATREQIKLEIVDVVERQRGCREGSRLHLALEKQFMELLTVEDETVMRISQLVNEVIRNSRLGQNATRLYKSYFKDA